MHMCVYIRMLQNVTSNKYLELDVPPIPICVSVPSIVLMHKKVPIPDLSQSLCLWFIQFTLGLSSFTHYQSPLLICQTVTTFGLSPLWVRQSLDSSNSAYCWFLSSWFHQTVHSWFAKKFTSSGPTVLPSTWVQPSTAWSYDWSLIFDSYQSYCLHIRGLGGPVVRPLVARAKSSGFDSPIAQYVQILTSWAFTYGTDGSLVLSWFWPCQPEFISFRCLWIQLCNNLGQRFCAYNLP